MKFNSLTYNISVAILGITALYTLVYSGLTGLLICSSVALIAAAFLDQFEIIVAVSVFFAMFYIFFLKGFLRKFEPFQNQDNAQGIVSRLAKMKDQYRQVPQEIKDPYLEPAGVYDPAIEGFEDVQPQVPKEGESSESSAAPSKRANEVDPKQVQEVTSAVGSAQKKSDKEIASQEMESGTGPLFKVGKMPSENSTGPMVDAGSTLQKAMDSLSPDKIKLMTADTKELMETQKGLMSLLKQVEPMVAEGSKMVQAFSSMFGNNGGGAGMPFKL